MKMRALLMAALVALGACASAQRTLSYPAGMPDADVLTRLLTDANIALDDLVDVVAQQIRTYARKGS